MKKLVFIFIAGSGLALASCGGTSASDNPDLVKDKVEEEALLVKDDVEDDVKDETESSISTLEKKKEEKSDKKKR